MALSNILAKAGRPSRSRPTPRSPSGWWTGSPTITRIEFVTAGRVPGIDESTFVPLH